MTCPDKTCASQIVISNPSTPDANTLILPIEYIANPLDKGLAFSFVINGLPAALDPAADFAFTLGVTVPPYNCEVVATIKDSPKTAADGVWIVGYLSTTSTAEIPAAAVSTPLLTITITHAGAFGGWVLGTASIATNPSGQDTASSPHPVFGEQPIDFTYDGSGNYVSGGTSPPYILWTGDVDGDDSVRFTDVQVLAETLANSYEYPFSADAAPSTLDADFNGILNATDIATTLAHIIGNGTNFDPANPLNVRISGIVTPTGFPKTDKVLASASCSTTLEAAECLPCSCPDLLEDIDETVCLSNIFISDYQIIDQPPDHMSTPQSIANFMPYGVVTISYQSRCNIDGYWLQLGNFKNVEDVRGGESGVMSIMPNSGEAGERRWFQSPGGDPAIDSSFIFEKDTATRLKTHNKVAFGLSAIDETYPVDLDLNDPVNHQRLIDYRLILPFGTEAYQPWALPKTRGKEPKVLTKLIVNPYSFEGAPTIDAFRFVTNDPVPGVLGGTWTGISGIFGGVGVSAISLATIISYVKLGGVSTASSLPTLAADALNFDAELDTLPLDIVDIWAVYNHILSQGVGAVTQLGLAAIPTDCCITTKPGTFNLATTAYGCGHINEGKVLVDWTTAPTDVSFYTIYRGVDGDYYNSSPYTGKKGVLTGMQMEQAMAQSGITSYIPISKKMVYEELVVINDPAATQYIDNNAPQNVNSCVAVDNPEITYIVVASNTHGERTNSATATVINCNSTPTALSTGVFQTNINNKISFSLEGLVTNTNSIKPWGACDPALRACDDLTFEVLPDLKGGTFNETENQTGKFIFYPAKDYVGPAFIRYRVTTSNGCAAENQLRINVLPSKFDLTVVTGAVNTPQYGSAKVNWDRLSGNILKYEIYRKLAAGPYALIDTINGPWDINKKNFVYSDTGLAIPDPCDPLLLDNVYTYRVDAIGFDGLAATVPVGKQVTVESYEASATIIARALAGLVPNNPVPIPPVVTACGAPGHPTVTLSWPAIAGAVNYQIWRLLPGDPAYKLIALTQALTHDDSPPYCDSCVPVSYNALYRIVTMSENGPSGDPNAGTWGFVGGGAPCTTGGETVTAVIPCCPPVPTTYPSSFEFCSDVTSSGSVVGKVPSGGPVTFAVTAPPAAGVLVLDPATGEFTYDATGVPASPPTYTFQYTVTACAIVSPAETVTIVVKDCPCPGFTDEENNYVIMDLSMIKDEYTLVGINQPPFSLSRRGGQTIRGAGRPYGVTEEGTEPCEHSLFDVSAISGLSLWLDPNDGTTLGMGPDVSRIMDKAGVLTDAWFEAPAAVNQPTVSTYNGKEWLDFDGDDEYLRGTRDAGVTPLYWEDVFGGRSFEIIVVTRPDDNSACSAAPCGNGSANPWQNTCIISDLNGYGGIFVKDMDTATPTIQCYMYESPGPGSPKTEYTQPSQDAHIYGIAQTDPGDPPNTSPFITTQDGAVTTITGVPQFITAGMSGEQLRLAHKIVVGSPYFFKGLIGEVLVFSRRLSDHERNIVTSYLRNKWGTL